MYHNKKYGITFNKEAKRKAVHMAKPQICAPHLARGVLETEAPEQKVKQMIRTGSLSSVLSVYCVHACTSVCVCVCWMEVEEESVCGEGVWGSKVSK